MYRDASRNFLLCDAVQAVDVARQRYSGNRGGPQPMFRILAIAGALLGLASVAQADVWRWTDPNGTIHYSDNWVPGSTLVKTESRGSYSSPAPPASTPAPD